MRTLLMLCLIALITGCNGNNPQCKAEKLINRYLENNLKDPDSYECIDMGKIGFNPRTYIRYDCITNNANIYSLLSMHLCDNKLFGFFIDEIKLIGVFNRLIINDCENSSFLLMLNVRKQLYYKFIFYIIGCDDTYVFNSFRIIISQEIETNTIFFMIDDIR